VEIVLQRVGEDGESAVFTYPFEGRIDAGEYVLIARRDGFEPSSQRVVIVANAANRIEVPPLIPTSLRGRLRVTCPASVSELQLASLQGDHTDSTLKCGEQVSLPSGSYAIRFEVAGHPFQETVEIGMARNVDLHLTRPIEPDTDLRLRDWGWITLT